MKIDGRTLDHKTLEHLRIAACKRVLEDGKPPSAVAASLGFCRTSIYPWLNTIQDEGWQALAEKIAEGTRLQAHRKATPESQAMDRG